ncbi:hypothetical protein FGO68_gene16266 [Halteria grandinella]|uniref:Uncharacterized protein n=1 Tax=Halteria grandinella TaxID=5974 RepID=A0A8J8T0G8_HALGN|nr:hypothetical protein FGO68_gene16266 [Halteria grandinella]
MTKQQSQRSRSPSIEAARKLVSPAKPSVRKSENTPLLKVRRVELTVVKEEQSNAGASRTSQGVGDLDPLYLESQQSPVTLLTQRFTAQLPPVLPIIQEEESADVATYSQPVGALSNNHCFHLNPAPNHHFDLDSASHLSQDDQNIPPPNDDIAPSPLIRFLIDFRELRLEHTERISQLAQMHFESTRQQIEALSSTVGEAIQRMQESKRIVMAQSKVREDGRAMVKKIGLPKR